MMKITKASWIWLIIPVINIPLGIGVYMVVKSQMQSIQESAAAKQAELIARAEQAERERAEAEARSNQDNPPDNQSPNSPPPRPPSIPSQPDTPPPTDSDSDAPGDFVLTVSCNAQSCDGLAQLTEDVWVSVAANTELEVPNGWTREDARTIRRRFRYVADIEYAPVEVEIKSQDGRAQKLLLPIDIWFNIAYDNDN